MNNLHSALVRVCVCVYVCVCMGVSLCASWWRRHTFLIVEGDVKVSCGCGINRNGFTSSRTTCPRNQLAARPCLTHPLLPKSDCPAPQPFTFHSCNSWFLFIFIFDFRGGVCYCFVYCGICFLSVCCLYYCWALRFDSQADSEASVLS